MKILNISSLIRNEYISKKKSENTILIDISKYFSESEFNVEFVNVYIHPKSTYLLSSLSKKWREYFNLSKIDKFYINSNCIYTLPVFILPIKSIFNKLLYEFSYFLNKDRLDRVFLNEKPEMIQALDVDKSAFFARKLSKKYGIPYIVNAREINSKLFNYIRNNLEESSGIISHGYLHDNIAKKQFPNVSSVLIPHGVDSGLFEELQVEYKIDNCIRLVSIGRLIKVKNFDKLILCLKEFDSISLDIYGDGPEKNYLLDLIRNLNLSSRIQIITKPYGSADLKSILSNYHMFCLISYPETFGRVYAEAAAVGLPILGSKYSGIYGQLIAKHEAFFVNAEHLNELKDVFDFLMKDKSILLKMRKNLLKSRYKFHWSEILEVYYSIYKTVLKGD